MILPVLLLLLGAEPLNDAPSLPKVVTLRLNERKAFRPGCVVNSVLGKLPNHVRVDVGKELVLVGSEMPIEADVELVCRFARPALAEDGVVICPEGSKPSAYVKTSGETVVECMGGAKQTFRLVVRDEKPDVMLPSTVELYEGESLAYALPCKPSRLTLSNSAAWIEVSGTSIARVVADRAGVAAQAIYCDDPEVPALQVAMKVWPFEKDLARNVKADVKPFTLFVGEARALFAPCEFETFEKTGALEMKKRKGNAKAWLVSAKAPGETKLQFACADGSKATVNVAVQTPSESNVPKVENNSLVMYEEEKRLFVQPCDITRMAVSSSTPDIRKAGKGVVSVKGVPGKTTAVMFCSSSLRANWLVEVLPW